MVEETSNRTISARRWGRRGGNARSEACGVVQWPRLVFIFIVFECSSFAAYDCVHQYHFITCFMFVQYVVVLRIFGV